MTSPTPLGLAYVHALQAHYGVSTLAALAGALGIGAPALSVRIRGTTPGHVGAMVLGLAEVRCTVHYGPDVVVDMPRVDVGGLYIVTAHDDDGYDDTPYCWVPMPLDDARKVLDEATALGVKGARLCHVDDRRPEWVLERWR
jgi:hypothetical protein